MSIIFPENIDYTKILQKLKDDFQHKWMANKPSPLGSLTDFKEIAVVGAGSFGTVKLCQNKKDTNCYAVKIFLKSAIIKSKQVRHVIFEKKILRSIRFPFLVHLVFSLKDNDCLYLGLPFINGGEMFTYLRKMRRFNELQAKFYAAQVFLAIEYLHFMNLIYRDLKPENILIDYKGYIKLTDFGFCKLIERGRTWTLCGTPEYIAPELIQAKGYGKSIDWWSFGVFVYEMVAGVSPFYTTNEDPMILFGKILDCKYKIPSFFSNDLRSLIFHLLQVDVTRRYGNLKNGSKDIKKHIWFQNVNWIALLNGEIDSHFIPPTKGVDDISNFDKYSDVKFPTSRSNQYEREFQDF